MYFTQRESEKSEVHIPIYSTLNIYYIASRIMVRYLQKYMITKLQDDSKGYCTGMIDTNKDSNTAHDTRPFLLVTSFLSENIIKIWIQQADNSCTITNHCFAKLHDTRHDKEQCYQFPPQLLVPLWKRKCWTVHSVWRHKQWLHGYNASHVNLSCMLRKSEWQNVCTDVSTTTVIFIRQIIFIIALGIVD